MKKAVWFISYKLKKGSDEAEFLAASEALGKGHISKSKGYIAWQQLKDGDTWVDMATWESLEDAKNFENGGGGGELAQKFYSFIDFKTLKSNFYTIEKNH